MFLILIKKFFFFFSWNTLNYWTVHSGDRLLTVCVFECDIDHRRPVAVLGMLYKIRCNAMHPLNAVLPVPYVPVLVTHGTVVAHRYTCAPPRCKTSQCRRAIIPLSVSLWNDLADPVFDGVGLTFSKSRANAFLFAFAARFHLPHRFLNFSLFFL